MPATSRDSIIFQIRRGHLPSAAPPRESSLRRMSWLEAEPGPEEEGVPRGAEETRGAKGARGPPRPRPSGNKSGEDASAPSALLGSPSLSSGL